MRVINLKYFFCILILGLNAATLSSQNLLDGLISVWEFDEISGEIANDELANHSGTIDNGVEINQEGLLGRSILTNSYDFISVGNSSDFDGGDAFSVSAWVKGGFNFSKSIMVRDVGTSYKWILYISGTSPDSYVSLYVRTASGIYTTPPNTDICSDNEWHHVVGVWNKNVSTARLKVYLDGELVASNDAVNESVLPGASSTYIGGWKSGHTFEGYIDQVAFWKDKALTQTEINLLYNSGNGLAFSQWENPISPLSGGEISPDSLSINTGESPETISSVSDASGGNGAYTYQWQLSTDGSTFSDISGATGTSYTAPVLTQNTWYRRKVTDGSSAEAYSNVSVIEVITSGGECLWNENAGYIYRNGKVSINTLSDPGDYTLAVNGKIRAKEIKVDTDWADYVFATDYRLKTLEEIESFIKENKHLPEIPTAQDVEKGGVDLGEMNMLLLKKVEELTLYIINQQKEINLLKSDLTEIRNKN